ASRLWRNIADAVGLRGRVYLAEVVLQGIVRHTLECRLAQSTPRIVDHALKSHTVIRIEDQLQISDDIFDFGAVVEPRSTNHRVRHAAAHQNFFYSPALSVRSIEHTTVGQANGARAKALELIDNEERLVDLIRGTVAPDLAPFTAIAAQHLFQAFAVI